MNNRKSLFVDANETYDDDFVVKPAKIIGLNESDTVVGNDNMPAVSSAESIKSVGGKMAVNTVIRSMHTGESLPKSASDEIEHTIQRGLLTVGIAALGSVLGSIFGTKK